MRRRASHTRTCITRSWFRSAGLALLAIGIVLVAPGRGAGQAASTPCQSSSPDDASYTVEVCLTNPVDGATVTGDTTVTATITVTSGTNPGVRRVVFYMDGTPTGYLLTDYQAPYTFTLPTARFVDGLHTLSVEAWMRPTIGGFITQRASVDVTFQNGVTTPPVNTGSWSPTKGTNPASGQPFVVAAAGDGAGGDTSETDVTNLIAGWNPNLMLYLGDVYENGTPTEFYNWYRPQAQAGTFYGRFRSITDPVIGNHEYNDARDGTAPGYFDYWDNIPHYYSYDSHGWHFIALDSTGFFRQTNTSSAQYQWLAGDLDAVDARSLTNAGKTSVGGSATLLAADTKTANKVTLAAGKLTKISAYLDGRGGIKGAGSTRVTAVVYTDASGNPGARVASSAEVTIAKNQPAGWVDFTFSPAVTLGPADYWLVLHVGGTSNMARLYGDTAAGASRSNTDAYADGVSDPFGAATTGNSAWSLYAAYTPADATACTIAYWHEPLWNIGDEGSQTSMSDIWALLAQHHVTLVVNGHDHTYQRWTPLDANGTPDPKGLTEMVVGTGGHAMGSFVTSDSRVAAQWSGFGALKLVLNPNGASFQQVSTQGQTVDSGSVACNPGASDTDAPTSPSGLAATPSYKTTIDLSWNASTDNVGVTGYEIYRDGGESAIATVGSQTTYSDKTVLPGSTHSYQVKAVDAAGNKSGFSNTASATTPLTGALFQDGFEANDHFAAWLNPAPTSAPQNNGLVAEQSQVLSGSWAAEATSTGLGAAAWRQLPETQTNLYYQTHFNVLSQSANVNLLRFRNDQIGANALATVFVTTTNKIGIRNDVTGVSTTSASGVAAPGSWHTLQAHALINGTSSLTEVWLDGVKLTDLSLSGIDLGSDPIGRLELGDPNSVTTPKSFDVAFDDVAYDLEFIGDSSPPTAPTNLAASVKSGLEVDVTWTAATDDVGVTGYELYRNGALLASIPPGTSYADKAVAPFTSYSYKLKAKDGAGNTSAFSTTAAVTTGDVFADDFETGNLTKWTTVSGVVVQNTNVDTGQWAAEATASGAAASAQVALDAPVTELYYAARFKLLSNSTNVILIRLRNNAQAATPIASVFVSTTGKLGFTPGASGSTTSATTVTPLVWHDVQLHAMVNGASSQADVWLDGQPVAGLSGLTPNLGTTPIGRLELGDSTGSRTFDVAFDNVVADPFFISGPAVPPDAPTDLQTTAVAANHVDLAWNAPSGGSAVGSYRVYRSSTQIATVDASTVTYSDTTVSDGTSYTYKVTAIDSVGRESAFSNVVSVTTPDATAPAKPTGLTANANGSTEIDLSWNASTDNVGVTGYQIYRGVSQIATVGGSTLTYADTGLSPSTQYTYTVTAIDAATNESTASDPATATTGSPPPPPAIFTDGFESGDLSQWTGVSGLVVQNTNVHNGAWAAEAKSNRNTAAYAVKQLPSTYNDLYARADVNILSGKPDTVDVLTLRTAGGTPLLSLYYDSKKNLGYRNETTNTTTISTTSLATAQWHEVKVHLVVNGGSIQVEVWVDGAKIAALSKADSFGSTPIGQVVAGESASGHAYDFAIDNVVVDTKP